MIYLLDTDMFIFMIRGLKSARHPTQRRRAEGILKYCHRTRHGGHALGLSAITLSELEFGAQNSTDYRSEITAVHKVISPFEIYNYDSTSCPPHYGRIRNELESRGKSIGSMDLLLAAHALALDATLVSNNTSHFTRVPGLKTANWLSD